MTSEYSDSEVKCRSKINIPTNRQSSQSSEGESNLSNRKNSSEPSNGTQSATIHMSGNLTQEEIQESMDSLKQKLDALKSMVESDKGPATKKTATFVDEHILSVIFALALVAILSVTVYAFQALYIAATRKRV